MDRRAKTREIMQLLRGMDVRMLCDVLAFIRAYSSAKKIA